MSLYRPLIVLLAFVFFSLLLPRFYILPSCLLYIFFTKFVGYQGTKSKDKILDVITIDTTAYSNNVNIWPNQCECNADKIYECGKNNIYKKCAMYKKAMIEKCIELSTKKRLEDIARILGEA